MRTIILALAVLAAGCTAPNQIRPAPGPFRDHKTPVALEKPTISRRIIEQRHRAGEVATGNPTVEGQLAR